MKTKGVNPRTIYTMLTGGFSVSQIAHRLNVSPQTITYHMRKRDWYRRCPHCKGELPKHWGYNRLET